MTQQNSIKGENDPAIFKEVREFLDTLNSSGGKPMETMNPDEARQVLTEAQNSGNIDYFGITESEQVIEQNGYKVNIHITKPDRLKDVAPVFIFIHGGGWVLGDYPTHRRLVRDLVVHSGAVAIFPDYTLSPEAQYPTAINEIYAVLNWVAEHGAEIGVDAQRLAVAGNSVGGNMAAVMTLMAKDKKGPNIKFQLLLWPVTDANFETASYKQYAEGRFLTSNMMKWFWNHYLPDTGKRSEVYASPLQATLEQLKGLPPALVQTAENDVLRDEGETYARKLNEAGVAVTLTRYNGQIHDYGLLNPLAHIPSVQTAILQAAAALKNALQ